MEQELALWIEWGSVTQYAFYRMLDEIVDFCPNHRCTEKTLCKTPSLQRYGLQP